MGRVKATYLIYFSMGPMALIIDAAKTPAAATP